MHIPDNYLSPQTCAVMTAVMVPVWAVSIQSVKREIPREKIPMLGVGAAFSFLGMMFNVPLPGGTTGHAVGGTLLSALLGPYAACLAISAALLLQALLFGDGGILSFGANCFNMAFVMPFVGYAVMKGVTGLLNRQFPGKNDRHQTAGLAAGSYLGINAAALCAAIEFGIQPALFCDAAGNALYCPYGLSVAVPAMMIGHLTVFGLAEVVYSVAVYAFLRKVSPESSEGMLSGKTESITGRVLSGRRGVTALLAALIVLTPAGLLAEGTAWGEWGEEEIASTGAGYTPAGMADGFSFRSLLPDYSFQGMPGWMGYILSAGIGVAVILILFKLIGAKKEKAS